VPDSPDLLAQASRCLLAVRGRRGPLLSPMAFWWDGAGLWMTTPATSTKVACLRNTPECAVWVPPRADGEPGALVHGTARIFGLDDPFSLALHGPSISGAVLALAGRNAGQIFGYVQDARHVPVRFWPRNRVVVRVAARRIVGIQGPPLGSGIAPPLPTVVPPDVRRSLGGHRRVTVAAVHEDELTVSPATLGAGFSLQFAHGHAPPAGARLAATIEIAPGYRPTSVVGLVLHGRHHPPGTLDVDRATWWHGFDLATADVTRASAPPGIELPD
jgi:hypothetical protein